MAHTVAIITLPGFNEIDSFVAARMIDSVPDLSVQLFGPDDAATSMAGVEVTTPGDWNTLGTCSAAIFGSGMQTFDHIDNEEMMADIGTHLADVSYVGSQCSGAAFLHRLDLLDGQAVCTDQMTAPRLEAVGVEVRIDAFHENGRVASSGGCLSSSYLAYWIIDRLAGREAADLALLKVVPVGEEADYQARVDRLIPAG